MPKIRVKEGDNLEFVLRRFKKACEKQGIFSEIKKREFYEKPSIAKKKKSLAARRKRVVKRITRRA